MEQPRVIGHVVAVSGFRLKVELSADAKSSSRATPDGVQRAVAINSYLTFDLGAGTHAIGVLSDLEARESYDPTTDEELTLQLTKPRRVASVQLLGTVRQSGKGRWNFDTGITVLPTLDTPAEVANPGILACVFGQPPQRNRPEGWTEGEFDFALEIGHQTGDENTVVKSSFNDLFSRPLAIVGNTGSGKSYTVASLLRSVIENATAGAKVGADPHIFILDINGEYASAFLKKEDRVYARDPNEAYVNGKKWTIPVWLMNSEEICEWLSASEQTQQPVLKAWWAYLKAGSVLTQNAQDYLENALASIAEMRGDLAKMKKKEVGSCVDNIVSFATGGGITSTAAEIAALKSTTQPHRAFNNFTTDKVDNPVDISVALTNLEKVVEQALDTDDPAEASVTSGDTPIYFPRAALSGTSALAAAASSEDAPKIEQFLTTLRMRLRTRLADRRWGVFTNYDSLSVKSTLDWFRSLGFSAGASKVTIIDLSMLAHEVLPYACATIGRVLLEAREKLAASKRYESPWVIVLEEAHNYARPARQDEDRGQALSRRAFERVAKEGRKFGLSLIVASQRPSEISPTIMSQCANFFSHRLQNPDDIDHFRRIIPRQAQRLLDQVTVLASGEAIVFGSAVHVPSRVKVRIPTQEPSSVTSAPFADWGKAKTFPVDDVLRAWGVPEVEAAEVVKNTTAPEAEEKQTESVEKTVELDDDIPF